ncbi:MAG: response regulator transcription factor [bacterium]|nr:response regulator transcription factor [bacterium]
MINAVLADDHEIVRKGIKILLEDDGHINVVAEASDGFEAIKKVDELKPDLLITDIRMPEMDGLQTTQKVRSAYPDIKILVLSMHDDEDYILKSAEFGADGYLLKDTSKPEFIKAIDAVMSGQKYFSGDISNILVNSYLNFKSGSPGSESGAQVESILTKRERQILSLIYNGVSNKDIAEQLGKSVRTIETHRFNIMKKLEVKNIAELLRKIDNDPTLKQAINI